METFERESDAIFAARFAAQSHRRPVYVVYAWEQGIPTFRVQEYPPERRSDLYATALADGTVVEPA